jgi:hypothetical protein
MELDITTVPCIGSAMHQNGVALVRDVRLRHDDPMLEGRLLLRLTVTPEVFSPYEVALDASAGTTWRSGPLRIPLHWKELATLTEGISGLLLAELEDAEGRVLLTQERELRFLAFDQWQGTGMMPELLAAFVTPNHPRIAGVLRRAADLLGSWGEPSSLNEYQSRSPDRVRKQAAAIYAALSELGLTYASAPASFEDSGQRIRLCDQLFDQGIGNCLDMSLLFASCAEAAGLHPIVVFVKGHAFAGLWLVEETFPDPVNDDVTLLTKRTAEGIHEILVVEATGMNRGSGMGFEGAVLQAAAHLLKPDAFQLFVDLRRARHARIRPLPVRMRTDEGWVVGEPPASGSDTAAPDAITVGPQPDVRLPVTHTRQQTWERRLLDLTLRNTLLSLRSSRTLVQLLSADPAGTEDRLSSGEELALMAAPSGWEGERRPDGTFRQLHASDPVHGLVADDERQRRLRTCLGETDLQAALTGLYRAARLSLEENGANTLYLAVGLMRWYETDASERPRLAPVLLMPVELVRRASHRGYVLRSREEETVANVTLLEMLRQDFGISVAGLDRPPTDASGIDVRTALNLFRQAVRGMPRWDVEDVVLLGNFSFSRFVMWNDIRTNAKALASHPIVQSLMEGRLHADLPADTAVEGPVEEPPLTEVLLPILADGSQVEAIRAANEGRSFVLHGPPGTGKSQTITNIIANALYRGRRVLFVAEKMAALEVVKKRLGEIGLGDFCLELHSNKTRKSEVLRRLKTMIEAPQRRSRADFTREADRIHALRDGLRGYATALHRTQPSGLSVFECMNRYIPHATSKADLRLDDQYLRGLTPDSLTRLEDLSADIQAALRLTGDPSTHPLRQVGLDAYDPVLREASAQGLRTWADALEDLQRSLPPLLRSLGLAGVPMERGTLDALGRLCRQLLGADDLRGPILLEEALPQRLSEAERIADTGAKVRTAEEFLDGSFREGWRALDASSLLGEWMRADQRWFLPRFLTHRRVRRTLSRLSLSGDMSATEVVERLQLMEERLSHLRSIDEASDAMSRLMPSLWSGRRTDWQALRSLAATVREVNGVLPHLSTDAASLASLRQSLAASLREGSVAWSVYQGESVRGFLRSYDTATSTEAELTGLLALRESGRPVGGEGWTGRSRARAELLLGGIAKLRDWCAWRSARVRAVAEGLSPWVEELDAGTIPPEGAASALMKNVYRSLANLGIAAEPELNRFNGVLFDEKVRRFTTLSQSFEQLTRQEILDRLHSRRPDLSQQARKGSEVGTLQRAIAGNGRGFTIRSLFDEASKLLADLCPCMLMSPISVAQYLSMANGGFDLVIFDEASQMATSEAVGSIARGRSLIVVGDPRQMPPTSFFGSQSFDEENVQSEDLESILDDSLALSFPDRHLRWHYRSRHESLIAFSNARFYENRLLTFPSASDIGSRVRWMSVEGIYDRGRGRNNPSEARALVDEVVRRMKDPSQQGRSLGIVTFNVTQQKLLQDLLDEAMASDPSLEAALLQSPEPLFVKNLENVQGDERDVILFSVGYGRDAGGRVSLNFGPLNREGGWRRLNVAVSRAREEMVVFSSLRPEDIDVSRTSSEGVAGLRAFLEYASQGTAALALPATATPHGSGGGIESEIAASLRARGYGVHTHVGCSGFRIDVAVVHPSDSSCYLLAVMCDGEGFLSTPFLRDRHLGRRTVLERLGWRVHQVWSAEWWEDPGAVVEEILTACGSALQPLSMAAETSEVPEMQVLSDKSGLVAEDVRAAKLHGCIPYRVAMPEGSETLGPEDMLLSENRVLLRAQVRTVMQTESPVVRRLLKRRVASAWGVTRIGTRIDRLLDEVIAELGYLRTEQSSGDVLWMPGVQPETMQEFRTPLDESQRRDLEDLPIQEMAAAALAIVRFNYSITEEDLLRELASVFGYARRSAPMDAFLREGIAMAAMFGRLKETGGRYTT